MSKRTEPKSYRELERMVRGFANHRRIQIMEILKKKGVKVVQVRVSEHENDSDVFRPALVR